MLSMSNLSEYGELLSALFRLALIVEALGLPSLDDADTGKSKAEGARARALEIRISRYVYGNVY